MRLTDRFFLFLIAYRWASMLPGVWIFIAALRDSTIETRSVVVLLAALSITLLISLVHRPFNRLLVRYPLLLLFDLLFAVGLVGLSGGTQSPFYLYALAPLLAGAFFFQMRGAVISAAAFTPLYLLAVFMAQQRFGDAVELDALIIQVVGIWLIAISFGYPSVLLKQLRQTHDELSNARDNLSEQNDELVVIHRQLEIIHDLTISLQAAPDVQTVQQRVLEVITRDLGFKRAIIGLVNPINERLENWRTYPETDSGQMVSLSLPLSLDSGPLPRYLLANEAPGRLSIADGLSNDQSFDAWVGGDEWLCIPLLLRENPVGILLVEVEEHGSAAQETDLEMLYSIASQAAVALGTTMMCIDRAQRLAVERERNRIARDIHDTVAQSLFGIVFSLDACIAMLPDQVDQVQQELADLRALASDVRHQVRSSIFDLWPSELALERFQAGLLEHANHCCNRQSFMLDFSTQGDFDSLHPVVRQTLFKVAQEAVANAARHSGADSAQVGMNITPDEVSLVVRDYGKGFDPVMSQFVKPNEQSFGLRGIQERIQTQGGEAKISSAPGQGTVIEARLPLRRVTTHG